MRRLALCVGINNYPGTSNDLSGCVNDARDWETYLAARGFIVTTLLDGDATRGTFLRLLGEHIAATGYRDRLVVTYSGHGSWVPDKNADEPDGRDEALVMADFGFVTDDELGAAYAQRRYGARLVFVADSCFSGTVTRLVSGPEDPHGRRPRFLPPGQLLDSDTLAVAEQVAAAPARGFLRSSDVLLLSGCQEWEVSYDAWFGTRPNGAFSRAALDTLNALPDGGSYGDLMEAMPLPTSRYPQTPSIVGSYRQVEWPAFT